MSSETTTRQWILSNKPIDMPDDSTFKLIDTKLPALKDGQVLAKTLYLSNDPAQRGWIQKDQDPERLYVPPVQQDAPMTARGLAKIVASKSSKFAEGSLITASVNWSEYNVFSEKECSPVSNVEGLSETHFLGALGLTGVTAYYGLTQVVKANKDDVVVISGAAGATGSMAVQIAKNIIGCKKVIGMAGTDSKCKWVESLGADVCLNYKSKSFEADLEKATEKKATVYYDNVGGSILDLMLGHMARYSRIAACGAISNYNDTSSGFNLKNWFNVISQRIEIHGFIVIDAGKDIPNYVEVLTQAYKDGKVKIGEENETVVGTKFEDVPKTWLKLFSGDNTGKLITKLEG